MQQRGVLAIDPICKELACGDKGKGAMATPDDIVLHVEQAMEKYEGRATDHASILSSACGSGTRPSGSADALGGQV